MFTQLHIMPDNMTIFGRDPVMGTSNADRDFRPISLFVSEMMQDRAIVTMED